MTKYELRFTKNTLTATLPMEIVDNILGYISHPITQYLKEHEELANDMEKEEIDYWLGTPKFKIEHALYMQHFEKDTDEIYKLKVYFKKQPKNVDICNWLMFKVCDNVGFVNVEKCNNHGYTHDECIQNRIDGGAEFYPIESKWGKKIMDTCVANYMNPFLREYKNDSRLQVYIDNDNATLGGFQYKRKRWITCGIVERDGWIFGSDKNDMYRKIMEEFGIGRIGHGALFDWRKEGKEIAKKLGLEKAHLYGRERLYHIWRHLQDDGEIPPYNPRKQKNPNIIKKKKNTKVK